MTDWQAMYENAARNCDEMRRRYERAAAARDEYRAEKNELTRVLKNTTERLADYKRLADHFERVAKKRLKGGNRRVPA